MLTKALAHVEMLRPYTLFHPGLMAVAGAEIASAGQAPFWRVGLAAVVTMCGWEAGHYAGDYFDRAIDALSKPSRPIPSGRISPREAFLCMVGLILAGYAAALALGWPNLLLALATTVLGIAYSRTFKGRAFLGNLDRGILGVCAVLFGALAVAPSVAPPLLLLALLALLQDAATNLVGAIRDVDGDRAAGCQTLPVVYGVRVSLRAALALAVGWILLGLALYIIEPDEPVARLLFACAAALALAVYLSLWRAGDQAVRPRALRAHKFLVAERVTLMTSFLALWHPVAASILLLVALAVSLSLQSLLRDRYERQEILVQGAEHSYA